jgi:hypothetical protein
MDLRKLHLHWGAYKRGRKIDRPGLERLIRYCARPVFSGERLEWAGESSSKARSRWANSLDA